MNTISKSKYEDTNKMFEEPKENEVNFIVKEKNADLYKFLIMIKLISINGIIKNQQLRCLEDGNLGMKVIINFL